MQHSTEELKRSLLACIDKESNVTDMEECLRIISILECAPITRKILEDSRLGKYVNEIRRKTLNQELSKRLKILVKKWRVMCQTESVNGLPATTGPGPGGGGGGGRGSNGRSSISPCLSVPSSVKSVGGCICLSPPSLPSSCNTSPIRTLSAPTTPSKAVYKSKTMSPCLTKGGPLSSFQRTESPRLTASTESLRGPSNQSGKRLAAAATAPRLDPPYTPSVENVPRTNAANKRLRKDKDESSSDLPPAKRSKQFISNGFDDDCSRDSVISIDRVSRSSVEAIVISSAPVVTANNALADGSQKRPPQPIRRSGRKRKRDDQNFNSSTTGADPLRQKMAVIGANSSRVKTTSELLYDLAQKKGDVRLARRASKLEERVKDKETSPPYSSKNDSVKYNKMEHMQKFLKSTPYSLMDDDDDISIIEVEDDSDPPTACPTPTDVLLVSQNPNSPVSNVDLLGITEKDTAEEILARLPALDLNTIGWDESPSLPPLPISSDIMSDSDDDDCDEMEKLVKKSLLVESALIDTLHSTNVECQNGNFDMDGRFREWHELILQKAYQDTPLVVLPYVVTDF